MEYEYIIIGLLSAALIGVVVCIIILLTKKTEAVVPDDLTAEYIHELEKKVEGSKTELSAAIAVINRTVSDSVASNFKAQQEGLKALMSVEKEGERQNNEYVRAFLDSLKKDIEGRLDAMNAQNAQKIEEMRKTVDEKLSQSLDNRVKLAFADINTRLVDMQKGFDEVQRLSGQVTKLNGVFTNVKTRGSWGEVTLENVLAEILPADCYKKQCHVSKGREAVDFAVVMPGGKGGVLLPIDAKFPTADYERLSEAYASGEKENVVFARKRLLIAVREQAKSIAAKYICVPETTNFAVMYLPTEGLFAEVAREPGFMDGLRADYRIIPCGPTTVAALLSSLMVGFTTLRIQQKSADVVRLMKDFTADFNKFTDLIDKIRKNSAGIAEAVDGLDKRSELMLKKINRIDLNVIEGEAETIEG